ncbi:MAG: MFS transporter [Mycobacteriales bacterium]
MVTTERPGRALPSSVFRGSHRATTVGLVISVTLIAFEAMAIATAMPSAVRDLNGLAYYSWPFTAFLVTSVVGIVLCGDVSDRVGAARPLLIGLAVFTAGLIIAGTAQIMAIFVLGRAIQGFGTGLVIVAIYVVIAHAYDEDQRPKVFAAISAAWVLPSVLGPAISGVISEHFTWRLVFLGLPPFIVLGVLLLRPALRGLPHHAAPRGDARSRVLLAVAAALGVAALQYAGQDVRWLSIAPAVAGVVLLVVALPRLLPTGTLRLRRGLPAVVAFRGLLAGAFFGADAFIPLMLSHVHGFRPSLAGLPLTVAALGWTAGAWWQGHRTPAQRHLFIRAGFALVATAVVGMGIVALPGVSGWLAAPVWIVGGLGMGLAMPTISVLTMKFAEPGEQGFASSALQISDVLFGGVCIGAAGVLMVAVTRNGASLSSAIVLVNLLLAVVAVAGALAAGRASEDRAARG